MDSTINKDIKFTIARRFHTEFEANLYASKLRQAGIQCFISNSAMSTMLPFIEGFTLHVPKDSAADVDRIFAKIDRQIDSFEEDFREADHEEIQYQKELNEEGKDRWPILLIMAVVILALLFFQYIAPRLGWEFGQLNGRDDASNFAFGLQNQELAGTGDAVFQPEFC